MALNLKRKRSDPPSSRKLRKYEDEELSENADSIQSEHDTSSEQEEDESGAEEQEWTGTGVTAPFPQSNHQSSRKPNKPPTGEELRIIKDAADLFRSNSFKLQIDALLPNVRPKPSRIPPLERFLLALHTFIMQIPSRSPQHPLEASRKLLKKGVTVPYTLPLPTEETKWKVGYESPSEITLVGSWPNKISVKPKDGLRYGVDLAVEMPDNLFQEKDYLNGRFFQKRAFYLAVIAASLTSSKNKLNVDVCYHSPTQDPRLTSLVLIPRKDDSPLDFTKLNAKIVIIPTLSKTCPIPINRLSPSHSNLRLLSSQNDDPEQQSRHIPSLTYNTSILRCFTPRLHLLSAHHVKNESPGFVDAVTLLRVWANQRGFTLGSEHKLNVYGFEGLGGWWSEIISMVILGEDQNKSGSIFGGKRKPLGRGLSSYQMFKAALDFLSKFEFEKETVFVTCATGPRFPPEEYDTRQQPVFVDSTSLLNHLSGIPRGALELLRSEAHQTLEILNQTTISKDSFDEVFLKDHRYLPTRFDSILRIDISNAKPRNPLFDEAMDRGSAFAALLTSMDALLHTGLGDRTKIITILTSSSSIHSLDQSLPNTPKVIYIGMIYHPQNATRLVDHGPSVDEQNQDLIASFRELWGDKSELRRFKDGRIVESVVWDVKSAEERAHVPSLMVQFLLERHFGITSSSSSSITTNHQINAIQGWQNSFDSVLKLPEDVSRVYLNGGLPVGFKNAMNAFDELVKAIKALDDQLPLATLNVSPISEALRYTSIFAPVPLPDSLLPILPPNARYLPYMDLVIEFERSSKWPDDLKAIQKIKLAFFESVAEGLMKTIQGSKAKVVIGDGVYGHNPVLDQSFLEVVTPEGWAFSLRIWNPREVVLLDRIIAGHDKVLPHIKPIIQPQIQKGKEYRDAIFAKEVYARRFIHAPRHHRAITSMCHRYSAYSGTVRLTKRWFASHWVLGPGSVSEEAIELICAKVFLGDDGSKYLSMDVDSDAAIRQPGVPGTKERGFASVVEFLKEWKWEEGIDVPIYGNETQTFVEENDESGGEQGEDGNVKKNINGETKREVKASTSSAWTITTDFDKEGKMWTNRGPDVVVAHRIKALALATWEYLQGIEKGNMDVKALFVHPTDDYDFIIQLNQTVLPRYAHNITPNLDVLSKKGKYANKMLNEDGTLVRPGFDPARMLFDDLQRVYVDTFKIFYDTCGGDRFGIVWDPSVKQPRPFRVLGGFSSSPMHKNNEKPKSKELVTLNETAIISEIERMGAGLISKIVARTR